MCVVKTFYNINFVLNLPSSFLLHHPCNAGAWFYGKHQTESISKNAIKFNFSKVFLVQKIYISSRKNILVFMHLKQKSDTLAEQKVLLFIMGNIILQNVAPKKNSKFDSKKCTNWNQNPKAKVRSKKCSNYLQTSGPVHETWPLALSRNSIK